MILKSFRHPVMFSARSALPCNLPLNPCAIHMANSEGPREQPREEGGDTTGAFTNTQPFLSELSPPRLGDGDFGRWRLTQRWWAPGHRKSGLPNDPERQRCTP